MPNQLQVKVLLRSETLFCAVCAVGIARTTSRGLRIACTKGQRDCNTAQLHNSTDRTFTWQNRSPKACPKEGLKCEVLVLLLVEVHLAICLTTIDDVTVV